MARLERYAWAEGRRPGHGAERPRRRPGADRRRCRRCWRSTTRRRRSAWTRRAGAGPAGRRGRGWPSWCPARRAAHPSRSAPRDGGCPGAGRAVRGDVDLFAELLGRRRIVGITGTNGKSTTTALIHHLLTHAGVDAVLGGNIGGRCSSSTGSARAGVRARAVLASSSTCATAALPGRRLAQPHPRPSRPHGDLARLHRGQGAHLPGQGRRCRGDRHRRRAQPRAGLPAPRPRPARGHGRARRGRARRGRGAARLIDTLDGRRSRPSISRRSAICAAATTGRTSPWPTPPSGRWA